MSMLGVTSPPCQMGGAPKTEGSERMELYGYRRSDGRFGFRNHVLVVPLSGCQMEVARRIAARVQGATCFAHPHGCDFQGPDFELFQAILEHVTTHPNVGGVLFLAMGCAATLSMNLPATVRRSGRLMETLNTQAAGTTRSVETGVEAARAMAGALAAAKREPVPASALIVGTKCGASDESSFKYCHPVVGHACDILVEQGATVVLSEDCELVPAAHLLAERASGPEVAARLRALSNEVNRGWKARFGYTLEDVVLKTVSREASVQRSLEHAAKAGSGPIRGFFDVSETIKGPGLVILNAPNTDLESVTALAAAGCTLTLFTTGRGTPVGSPASITLKITATRRTFERMGENIDLCVAGVGEGSESLEDAARRVVQAAADAANGQLTKAEHLHHWEVAIPIRGVTY